MSTTNSLFSLSHGETDGISAQAVPFLHVLISVDSGETLVSRSCALDSGDGGEDIASDSGGRRCRVIEVGAEEEAATAAGNNETAGVKRRMLNSCIHKCRDGTIFHLAT